MDEDQKELEVVSGDGTDLDISPVYDHLAAGKPKCLDDKPKNIVIPKIKKEKQDEDEDDNKEKKSKI